jgi:hypothetical protein
MPHLQLHQSAATASNGALLRRRRVTEDADEGRRGRVLSSRHCLRAQALAHLARQGNKKVVGCQKI